MRRSSRPLAFVALALSLSALGAAQARAASPSRETIVVHLPGASGAELAQRFAAGELDAGGFAPFFERGEQGPDLVPVDPALPAAAGWTISSARRPGELGFRLLPPEGFVPAGNDVEALSSAPPPEAATLWRRAAAAERSLGAVFWPGLDDSASGERGTWGVPDRVTVHYPERFLVVDSDGWLPAGYGTGPGPERNWSLPPTVKSFSPPRRTGFPFLLPHERPDRSLIYELVAVDRTDDGRENYDGVLVSSKVNPRLGYVGVAEPGEWFRLELETVSGLPAKTPQIAWIKVMELAPDLSRSRISVSETSAVRPFPAGLVRRLEKDGTTWPGRPDRADLVAGLATGYGVDLPTFVETAERFAAYAVDVTLAGRVTFPTDLTLLSIPVLDEVDRALLLVDPRQPAYEEAAATSRGFARTAVFRALDRQLARLLASLDLGKTTVFLVSGYANAPIRAEVDLAQAVRDALPGDPLAGWSMLAAGGYGEIVAPPGAAATLETVRAALAAVRDGDAPIFARVANRKEAKKLGFEPSQGPDLRVWARPGYRLRSATEKTAAVARRPGPLAAAGWLSSDPASHGLWLALGAGIEKKTLKEPLTAPAAARRIARAAGIRLP